MASSAELAIRLGLSGQGAVEKGLRQLADQLESIGKAAAVTVAAGVGVAATGLVALGKVALDAAGDYQQAMNDIVASTGMSEDAAKRLADVGVESFKDGFGGSIKEATNLVVLLDKTIQGLDDSALKRATAAAAGLHDTFGADVGQTVDAAKTLMDNFGLSSEQAFDFIAKGFQSGLNRSGDFLETITEYATQFKAGGASAEQFFSTIKSGMQGGVLGTDKAADTFKEFRVRIQDGSKLTSDSLKMLGLDADDIAKKMALGQMTAAQAFQLVNDKLRETTDSTVRMQAGVGLMGTQFEDIGTHGALAIDMVNTKLSDMTGAADKLGAKYKNIGSFVQGMWRRAQVAMIPLGKALLDIANSLLPMVERAFSFFERNIGQWIGSATNAVKTFIGALQGNWEAADGIDAVSLAVGNVGKIIRDVLSIAGPIIDRLVVSFGSLGTIAKAALGGDVRGAVDALLAMLTSNGQALLETLAGWGRAFVAWIGPMIPPMLAALGGAIDSLWQWIKGNGPAIAEQLGAWGQAFVEWITPMIPPMLRELGRVAKNVGAWIGREGPPLLEALITEWAPAFAEWVGTAAAALLRALPPLISRLIAWIEREGPGIAQTFATEWVPAFVGWVNNLWEKLKPKLGELLLRFAVWVATEGAPEMVKINIQLGEAIVRGIGQGIANMAKWLWDQVGNLARGAVQSATDQIVRGVTGGGGSAGGGGGGGYDGPPSYSPPSAPDTQPPPRRGLTAYGMSSASLPANYQPPAAPAGVTVNGPVVGQVVVQGEADEDRLVEKINQMLMEEWQSSTGMSTRTPSGTARRV